MLSADNQQERLETGNFLAGFAEGEGSFNVSQRDPTLLYLLKQTLECGVIKKRKDGVFSLDVTTPSDVVYKVIPFFKKFPLRSRDKCRNFDLFVKAATLMKNGEHKNRIGLRKILEIREQINLGKGRTRKYSIFDVFPV